MNSCHPPQDEMAGLIGIYAFQGFYGLLSVVVYTFNIRALRHHKNNLDKSFSLLYTCCAALSLTYFLDHFLIRRFVKLGFFCEIILENFGEPNYWMMPYKTIASYCPIAILVFHALIAAHRFSIVAAPMRGVQLWDRYRRLFVLVGFLIPLIFMWFMIPCKSYAELDSEGSGGLDIEYKKVFSISSSLAAAIAAVLFGVLTLCLTFGMLIALAKLSLRKLSQAEISLIVFEVFMTVFTLIYAFTQGILYYSIYIVKDMELKSTVIQFRTFAIDIFILPQAWTLLFLSTTVRRYTLRAFGKRLGVEFLSTEIEKSARMVSVAPATISLQKSTVLNYNFTLQNLF
ncbi:Serpentine receptor class gamma-69 [Caenorhabditis elegans]|uniref:Serpentine receptor class gamma-69 n=1 Tax=Caenorhabditis elegans TaxID=6239 RepID=SRG69_CAEEL|nr:Serpentine receptor class gamma-69 [Caenorhabditis elegans]Q19258.3 RecName: Full=Serpentine receptor class gamma-69; Short=Protein srg-69 [Caenorhabditis elegans]CCD68757.1 Serpentine receptor class gamma-69 [Caenorhabditis elegans]|eukprot:NP_872070.1 Serpentine receptor class gamma-69 [Caenorhabditis elegans]